MGDRAVIAVFVLSFAFFSGETTNEQQVWVTVRSLLYLALLLLSSPAGPKFAFFSAQSVLALLVSIVIFPYIWSITFHSLYPHVCFHSSCVVRT